MVTKSHKQITLSAGAVANGWPMPVTKTVSPGMGDFATRNGGRERRNARRDRIATKRAWLEG